jgi:type I restriction enzyme M protein
LYIIELDEEKVNPYYIKAFLDSKQGREVLKSIAAGATMPTIGVDKLRKIEIPLPPMEEQRRIARKYQAALDSVSEIRSQLKSAINKLEHIFDEEAES